MLGLLQTLFFLLLTPLNGWQPAALAVGLVVSIGLAIFFARGCGVGDLYWSGETWHWSGFEKTGDCALRLHLDFQSLVLVSLRQPAAPTVWLWLHRGQFPLHWIALRRAVVHGAVARAQHALTVAPPHAPR